MREFGRADLLACCASARWADALIAHGPYQALGELTAVSEAALAALSWPDVLEALAAHPRIGDRAAGAGREASWSRAEQSGTAHADAAILEALRQGNETYERRFGHVYLICATGRPAEEMLDLLLARLANDPEVEQKIVRDELGKIVKLRLAKLWEGG